MNNPFENKEAVAQLGHLASIIIELRARILVAVRLQNSIVGDEMTKQTKVYQERVSYAIMQHDKLMNDLFEEAKDDTSRTDSDNAGTTEQESNG